MRAHEHLEEGILAVRSCKELEYVLNTTSQPDRYHLVISSKGAYRSAVRCVCLLISQLERGWRMLTTARIVLGVNTRGPPITMGGCQHVPFTA
jgi:hypothetical protein